MQLTAPPDATTAIEDHPHMIDPSRLPRQADILVVGVGGTGGFVAESLCRLLTGHPASITLVDHDIVERHNLLRQNFYPEDIGQHKSRALATRLSRQFDRPISFSTIPVSVDRTTISPSPERRPNLIVSCVDNAAARISLNTIVDSYFDTWLIDTGNGDHWGQVLIGNTTNEKRCRAAFQRGICRRLPTPLLQRPDLSIDPPDRISDLDCAAAMDLTEQDPTINQLMAALTTQMVRRLIAGSLNYMSLYADQATGTVRPTYATPNNAARLMDITVDDILGRDEQGIYHGSLHS